jgi:hypothetical protein
MARWSRYDLITIDEVGCVPLAQLGPEFLFQVIVERSRVDRHEPDFRRVNPDLPMSGSAKRCCYRSDYGSRSHSGDEKR